ncbi:SMP-30/gluconolactonase/LRE family protein [Salinigranum salinum]|uniref:SMP-30/gluconolactonase/LRE family protein n=1 Tax=Salinigranum salinum TaxID=1364937 RepID=UPI001260EC15|nr:SMP-30/gluconolactonase/LRE family protein [Salinigranum salinum]
MSDRDTTIGADRTHSIGRAGRWTRRQALTAMGASAAFPFAVTPARAKKPADDYEVEDVVSFTPDELPEAITVDRRGNKYLTFPLLGEIRDVPPRGTEASEFASDLSPVLLGIAATPPGDLYTVSTEFGGGSRAVYRVSRDGEVETLKTFDMSGPEFLNGIVAEGDRWLISDSAGGAVWSFADGVAEEWVTSPLLDPMGGDPPIGANGVALDRVGDLYVANSDKQHIVRIPIEPDGSAGTPDVWAEDDRLQGADGIRFDTRENLYVAVNDQHAVVRVSEDRNGDATIETLASAEEGAALDFPSDLAFGTARGEQKTLFVVNFAFTPFGSVPKPGLVKIDVGVPGLPINR